MTVLTTILSASIPAVALIIVQIIVSMKQQRVQDIRFEMTIKEIKEDITHILFDATGHTPIVIPVINKV